MAELKTREEDEDETETQAMEKETASRKEKRKALKKAKRKGLRREIAEKERLEAEARRDDPAEQARLSLAEQEEAERSRRERDEFEARERAWLAAMEENQRRKALEEEEEEERRRKALDGDEASRSSQQLENENDDDGDWEYIEDGPPEIIWQGNEIILKKKRVKVPKKKDSDRSSSHEDKERPISNPFPPESEALAEQKSSSVSGRDSVGSIAQQVPNFGTEQDKAHCPFHLKTGVCRFGQRCSRVHFYPDKSCTLLMKNMYNGPGLAWEQDEGLEYTDEEIERCYEEFYEDVHTEFLKFGEIINFKVCRNGSFHLRGNVYVHFKSLDSAVLAFQTLNARYFAGKQVNCEFVNVSRWKIAICGEYMKTRFKSCSRGTACNFIHCFRNPGNDYEWADSDKPPPKYWVKNMIALFGFSDDSGCERRTLQKNLDHSNSSDKIPSADADKYRSRRLTSREKNYLHYKKEHARGSDQLRRHRNGERDKTDNTLDENAYEDGTNPKDSRQRKRRTHHAGGELFDDERERSRDRFQDRGRKSSRWNCEDNKSEFHDSQSYGSSKYQRPERLDDHGDRERENRKAKRDRRGKGRDEEEDHESRKSTSRHSDRKGRKRGRHSTDREGTKRDGDEWLDNEKAKHFKECLNEVSDPSDDEGELAKSSNSRDRSRKEIGRTDSFDQNLRSQWSNDPSCSSEYNKRHRSYDLDSRRISGAEIAIVDRWEPETHGSV